MAGTIFLLSGCNWYFGKEGLRGETHAGTNRTLVIFLPPIHGKGLEYEKKGFIQAVRERGFEHWIAFMSGAVPRARDSVLSRKKTV